MLAHAAKIRTKVNKGFAISHDTETSISYSSLTSKIRLQKEYKIFQRELNKNIKTPEDFQVRE